MGELEEKLDRILNNPQAMGQIMALAQSLGKGGPQAPQSDAPSSPPPSGQPPAPPPEPKEGLMGALGQIDPRLLSGAFQLMSQYQSQDDGRTALLQALRPFVREKRYAKLDKAIQIAKLSRLIRMALELLRPREDPHV